MLCSGMFVPHLIEGQAVYSRAFHHSVQHSNKNKQIITKVEPGPDFCFPKYYPMPHSINYKVCPPHTPDPDQNIHPYSYPSLKNTPFSRILDEKIHPFFNRCRWFYVRYNTTFKANAILFSLYQITYTFCESEINCIKHCSMYILFPITSNLERVFKCSSEVYSKKSRVKAGRYMHNFTLFQNCVDLCLKIYPFFMKSQICAMFWK